ncbi:MAG: ankyrin repeat domain-containing protein [Myxococcales bacterium]|nr:ankyrin repeat domain-containing protein [Myxococcales bacterium]USN50924.1 MAG: ankyrin repeat domain-containing protein [Myxococcales bacterium]
MNLINYLNTILLVLTFAQNAQPANFSSILEDDLLGAVEENNTEKTRSLLKKGKPEGTLHYALQVASSLGYEDIVKLLLKYKAPLSPETPRLTHLFRAVTAKNINIVKLLISAGADINLKSPVTIKDGKTILVSPVAKAIFDNNIEMVKLFLEYEKIELSNIFDSDSALHIAAMEGLYDMTGILLTRVNVNEENSNGETPLNLAVKNKHLDIIKLLFQQNDLNVKYLVSLTVLHQAINEKSDQETIDFLMEQEACKQNCQGISPLHWAAKSNNSKLIKHFHKNYHANLNAVTDLNKTPLDLAITYQSFSALVKLIKLGAADKRKIEELAQQKDFDNSILIFTPSAIRTNNLTEGSLHGKMSGKFLNLSQNANQYLPITVDFKLIDRAKNYYEASFSPDDNSFKKTMILQMVANLKNLQMIDSFRFIEKTKQGIYKESKNVAFAEDNKFKKDKKGKPIRNDRILSFIHELSVSYTDDYQSIIIKFTGNDGKNNYSEQVTLSKNPEFLPIVKEAVAPKKIASPGVPVNNSNNIIITEKNREVLRPTLDYFLGSFKGSSNNNWHIASAEIKSVDGSDNEYQMKINVGNPPRLASFNFTLELEDKKVANLKLPPPKRTTLYSWKFFNGFNVELNNANEIILSCEKAKSKGASYTQQVVFTLERSEKITQIDFPQTYESDYKKPNNNREYHTDVNNDNSTKEQVDINKDLESEPKLSKNKRKKMARKARAEKAKLEEQNKSYQDAWTEGLLNNKDDDFNSNNLALVQSHLNKDNSRSSSDDDVYFAPVATPKKIKQKPVYLNSHKDTAELTEKHERPLIKLNPGRLSDCPLLPGLWFGEGYADNGRGLEKIPNKKIVLSLENLNGLKNSHVGWGSLWASSLGASGNYSNGKDVHWSYHQQNDGNNYLHVSHHYLFNLKASKKYEGFYELHVEKISGNKTLSEVNMYLIRRQFNEKDTAKFASDYIGFKPDLNRENLETQKREEILSNVINKLSVTNFKLSHRGEVGVITWDNQGNAYYNGEKINSTVHLISEYGGIIELNTENNNNNNNSIKTRVINFKINKHRDLVL